MNYQKGSTALTAVLVVFGIIVLVVGGYLAMNPEVFQGSVAETPKEDDGADESASVNQKDSIEWKLVSAGEVEGVPSTTVTPVINGTAYDVGTFQGSCSEIGASGGIDSKGLLAGELSAMQCWFAGGGNEIGVFAHEDGGFDIMVGELSEGEEGAGIFRGKFSIKHSILP